jgi:2Fe-2S ferredoxin
MAEVTFVSVDGSATTLDIADGVSLMEGAVRAGIAGVDAECGGNLACGTCRVVVETAWASRLDPPDKLERELLEYAPELNERSRLSCQIKADSSLDGLVVHVPASQR